MFRPPPIKSEAAGEAAFGEGYLASTEAKGTYIQQCCCFDSPCSPRAFSCVRAKTIIPIPILCRVSVVVSVIPAVTTTHVNHHYQHHYYHTTAATVTATTTTAYYHAATCQELVFVGIVTTATTAVTTAIPPSPCHYLLIMYALISCFGVYLGAWVRIRRCL